MEFGYVLNDLSRLEDDDLRGVAVGRLALFLLRDVGRPDFFTARLPRTFAAMRDVATASGLNALRAALQYILETADDVTPEALARLLVTEVAPEVREVVMTAGQRLREEGRAEGRAEGRVEGRAEGRVEGSRRVLLSQLTLRFGALPGDATARIAAADEATLDVWIRRVLTAQTLDDVLA